MRALFLLFIVFYSAIHASDLPVTESASSSSSSVAPAPTFLNWEDRPQDVQDQIDSAFSWISGEKASQWGKFNGSSNYYLLGLDEQIIVKKIIQEAKEQKEFYLLDIGAGNFQWGASMAQFINSQEDLPPGIKVHIFSIRGESGASEEPETKGKCILYNLGSFEVENLAQEFKERKYALGEGFDFIISNWCFPHLVDGANTYAQAFDLLRPVTGIIMMDAFRLLYHDDDARKYWHQEVYQYGPASTYNFNRQMLQLLAQIKAPLLLAPTGETVARLQFMVRRPNEEKANLPLRYKRAVPVAQRDVGFARGATYITQYYSDFKPYKLEEVQAIDDIGFKLYGNYDLYKWLPAATTTYKKWMPFLLARDLTPEAKVYQVALAEKEKEVEKKAIVEQPSSPEKLLEDALREKTADNFQSLVETRWSELDDEDKAEILRRAINRYSKNPDFIDIVLAQDINVDFRGFNGTALHQVVWKLQWNELSLEQAKKLAQKLLDKGASIDKIKDALKTPLQRAQDLPDKTFYNFLNGKEKKEEKAIAQPPFPEKLLEDALREETADNFRSLVETRWNELDDKDRAEILRQAINRYKDNPTFANVVLAQDINVDFRDGGQGTALHQVIWKLEWNELSLEQAEELAEKLLGKGASIDKIKDVSKTPLQRAQDLPDQSFYEFLKSKIPSDASGD